jgi:hypothetical protein
MSASASISQLDYYPTSATTSYSQRWPSYYLSAADDTLLLPRLITWEEVSIPAYKKIVHGKLKKGHLKEPNPREQPRHKPKIIYNYHSETR